MRKFGYIPAFAPCVPDLLCLTSLTLTREEVRGQCLRRGWGLTEDDPRDNFVRFELLEGIEAVACFPDEERSCSRPLLFLPLYYTDADEEYNAQEPGDERHNLEAAFVAAWRVIADYLGDPFEWGTYSYHRSPDWTYGYAVWWGERALFILLQDEFDIQFGRDVSIWLWGRREGEGVPSFPLQRN